MEDIFRWVHDKSTFCAMCVVGPALPRDGDTNQLFIECNFCSRRFVDTFKFMHRLQLNDKSMGRIRAIKMISKESIDFSTCDLGLIRAQRTYIHAMQAIRCHICDDLARVIGNILASCALRVANYICKLWHGNKPNYRILWTAN